MRTALINSDVNIVHNTWNSVNIRRVTEKSNKAALPGLISSIYLSHHCCMCIWNVSIIINCFLPVSYTCKNVLNIMIDLYIYMALKLLVAIPIQLLICKMWGNSAHRFQIRSKMNNNTCTILIHIKWCRFHIQKEHFPYCYCRAQVVGFEYITFMDIYFSPVANCLGRVKQMKCSC